MVHRMSHATGLAVALTDQAAGASGSAGPRPLLRANVLPSFADGALQSRAQVAETSAASRTRATLPSAVPAAPPHDGSPVRTDALHRLSQIRDRFEALLQTFLAWSLGGSRQARLFEGVGLIPQPFMKHAQSRSAIKQWQAEHPSVAPEAPVNKKGQTLMSRHEEHRVERHPPNGAIEDGKPMKPLNFSASIEQKRITYMDRALDHLRTAPESECQGLIDRLETSGIDESGMARLDLDKRFWGPART